MPTYFQRPENALKRANGTCSFSVYDLNNLSRIHMSCRARAGLLLALTLRFTRLCFTLIIHFSVCTIIRVQLYIYFIIWINLVYKALWNRPAFSAVTIKDLVLQRKPFAFELFFCWAKVGFLTFSSKTCSIVPTSNICRNVQRPKKQLNQ